MLKIFCEDFATKTPLDASCDKNVDLQRVLLLGYIDSKEGYPTTWNYSLWQFPRVESTLYHKTPLNFHSILLLFCLEHILVRSVRGLYLYFPLFGIDLCMDCPQPSSLNKKISSSSIFKALFEILVELSQQLDHARLGIDSNYSPLVLGSIQELIYQK